MMSCQFIIDADSLQVAVLSGGRTRDPRIEYRRRQWCLSRENNCNIQLVYGLHDFKCARLSRLLVGF